MFEYLNTNNRRIIDLKLEMVVQGVDASINQVENSLAIAERT